MQLSLVILKKTVRVGLMPIEAMLLNFNKIEPLYLLSSRKANHQK